MVGGEERKMAKLIVLRGNSGSGKTTVAKALQEKIGPNTMLISHDMVRMQMLHVWGALGIEKSLPLMIQLVKYGHAHSEVTILEGILASDDYAPLFDACVALYGDDIFAYYYDLSFEETVRRHATKPNRDDFGTADMRRWWRGKDCLEQVQETILNQDVTLKEAVESIYRNVMGKDQ